MGLIPAAALALACISCFHIRICMGKAEHRLHHETSDVGKVVQNSSTEQSSEAGEAVHVDVSACRDAAPSATFSHRRGRAFIARLLSGPRHEGGWCLRTLRARLGKVFASFPYVVAIYDIDKDGDLDCLSAVRTDYDSSIPRTAYVWIIPGINGHRPRNITYDVEPTARPDVFHFWDRYGDGTVETGRYIYTDYKDCIVMFLYERKDCILWTSLDVRDGVPQICMDFYEDNCGIGHMSYDHDTCSPFIDL